MSLRQAILGLVAFLAFAFASLWVLKQALDPVVVESCLERGGTWDATTKRCVHDAAVSARRSTEHLAADPRVRSGLSPTPVRCDTISGEVRHGESFGRAFGNGYRFRLVPAVHDANPQGWTIEVVEDPDGERDYVWLATPPYRFANARDLTTSYGRTASEVVSYGTRPFGWATRAVYEPLAAVVDTLLWPQEEMSQAAYDSVLGRWNELIDRAGTGKLRIVDAHIAAPTDDRPEGRIEWLAFETELCPGPEIEP